MESTGTNAVREEQGHADAHCAAGAAQAIAETIIGLGLSKAISLVYLSMTAFEVWIENALVYASRSKRTCLIVCVWKRGATGG